jgi:predicted MPP superfamily phosphohydrolase
MGSFATGALFLGVGARKVGAAQPEKLRATHHLVRWPSATRRFRVVQLTDIHVGRAVPPSYLRRVAELAHRARPDLVVLTGDYLNRSLTYVDELRHFVSLLPRPLFATLGNHDHWSGRDGVVAALEQGGATVLSNESLRFAGAGLDLVLVGVDDGFTRSDDVPRAFARVSRAAEALVLSHFPNTADRIADTGARLILSGHTHGGQIVVPGVTQLVHRVLGHKYVAGWFELDRSQLYVSVGVGGSVGLRAGEGSAPEVSVFDLLPPAHPALG